MLTANAGALKERLRRLERYGRGRHHPSDRPRRAEASVIIFHCVDVEGRCQARLRIVWTSCSCLSFTDIDASALQLIYELVESYASRSVLIYWTQIQGAPLERLRKAGVLERSGGGKSISFSARVPQLMSDLHPSEDHVQPNVQMALQVLNDTMLSHLAEGGEA